MIQPTKTLSQAMKERFNIVPESQESHIHLNTPIEDIELTDQWIKLPIGDVCFKTIMEGKFTLDDVNHRVYWDASSELFDLKALFIGDAGLKVTEGLAGLGSVALGLAVNGTIILETPLDFTALDKAQGYGANGVFVNPALETMITQGSYYEFFAKAGTGENLTATLAYFNTTILQRL